MRNLLILAATLAQLFGSAAIAECPAAPVVRNEILTLIAKAQSAKSFTEGRRVSGQMWLVWLRAPDEQAQTMLDTGMSHRETFDFPKALAEFDGLIAYCPAYAEGWNQRAYIHFLSENYEQALADLDAALILQPFHIAAQSGRALTLMNLGRLKEARAQLLNAVDNNPWLSERALLEDGAPLGLQGKEL